MLAAPTLIALLLAPGQRAHDEPASAPRGLELLYTKAYQGFGLTADEYDRLWTVWPAALREEARAASPAARRALADARYGLPSDPARGADVPVGFAETAPGRWTLNCLACHGGDVDGRYVPGLGNSRFAFQTFVRDVLWLRREDKTAFTEQDEGMAVATLNTSDGTTAAQVFSAVFLAFRDTTLERLPEPDEELLASLVQHDLDAPPLWNVAAKSRLYCDGYVAKDHRVVMQFALALENDGATIRGFDDDFRHVMAWIESLQPPEWPVARGGALDTRLAARGEEVFARTCARCHGTYGPGGRYPELRVELDEVGTDPLRSTGLPRRFKERLAASWIARAGQVDVDLDAEGYLAPSLRGVWATAPYLHNGAVPTLRQVLRPDERPRAWRRARGYDYADVGLVVEAAEQAPRSSRADERRRWFDASLPGKSIGGHEYGRRLSEDELAAVLEYLKRL